MFRKEYLCNDDHLYIIALIDNILNHLYDYDKRKLRKTKIKQLGIYIFHNHESY